LFIRMIGGEGKTDGLFNLPAGLIFDFDGNLVVCDSGNGPATSLFPR
jgi:hypothetical protein